MATIQELIRQANGKAATVWKAYAPQNAWGAQEATLHISLTEEPPAGVVSHRWYNAMRGNGGQVTEPPVLVGRIAEDGTYTEVRS